MDHTESSEMWKQLHSGEHIFIRSLQNLGLNVHVRKADTERSDESGRVYIREKVTSNKIFLALEETNHIINADLTVSEESFNGLDAAVKKFPKLRYNDQRIEPKDTVRVVRMGEFDFSACKHLHVKNTKEIVMFMVTGFSYLHGETEVRFLAGEPAISHCIKLLSSVIKTAYDNNFQPEILGERFEKLKSLCSESDGRAESLFNSLLESKGNGVVKLKEFSVNNPARSLHKFLGVHKAGYLILLSEKQILGLRGVASSENLSVIGKELKDEETFIGDFSEDHIMGKVTDYKKAAEILDKYGRK
jgi:alanyl-tRNA synthetase